MKQEEAMKILKDFHDKSALFSVRTALDTIIPELRESEDEKIRKKLIHLVKKSNEYGGYALHKWEADEMLAWLEKQGEQKLPIEKLPEEMKTIGESLGFTTQEECDEYNQMVSNLIMSDKVEPKFKVGDKITKSSRKSCPVHSSTDDTICEVAEVHDTCYILNTKEGRTQEPFEWQDYYELVESVWSEEDERIYQSIMDDTVQENQLDRKQIDWIRDIKYRYFSQTQNTWKPSDEQLYFLHWLATNVLTNGEVEKKASEVLESLYNDLKKLKGE